MVLAETYNDSSLWVRHLQISRARHNLIPGCQDLVHGTDMAVETFWEHRPPYKLLKHLTALVPGTLFLRGRYGHGVLCNRRKA